MAGTYSKTSKNEQQKSDRNELREEKRREELEQRSVGERGKTSNPRKNLEMRPYGHRKRGRPIVICEYNF